MAGDQVIEFDQAKLKAVVDGLQKTGDSCGLTVQWLVWDTARMAANNCVKYTAPWAAGSKPGNTKRQRDTGQAAITFDLLGRAGTETTGDRSGLFGFLTDEMKMYQSFNGGDKLPNFNLVRLKSGAVYLVDKNVAMEGASAADLARIHKANRGRKGRVSTAGRSDRQIGRWKAKNKYFAPKSTVLGYLKTVHDKTGTLKAGWLAAARYFASRTAGRVSVPKWIARHGDLGAFRDGITRQGNGHARLINTVPHAPSIRPSFFPFVQRVADRYVNKHLEKRIDKVCERFQKQQADAKAVTA